MSHGYSLPPRKARICRIAGAIFLLLAAGSLLGPLSVGIAPGFHLNCATGGCRVQLEPDRLLEQDQRPEVVATPAARRRFEAYAARPLVRVGIALAALVRDLPFAILLLGIGIALRRLGARAGSPLAEALPWLRRASQAAMVAAIMTPLGNTLAWAILSHGTPDGLWITVDTDGIATYLMLGAAAYAAVWALESGLRAQRDLDDFV